MPENIGEYFFGAGKPANKPPVNSIPGQIEVEYGNIISQYIPYFNSLPEQHKKKFLQRTIHFRSIKEFVYIGMEEKPEIPVLISAAAVQLTLGLEKFELPYFKNIFVTPDVYLENAGQEMYVGHVSPSGIYIAWKYFLHGFYDQSDNVNVAIHEMAHALKHENFMKQAGVDREFRKDFEKFTGIAEPIFGSGVFGNQRYLRSYAYTNMQEFWAVSVEAFFENPAILKQNIPELYGTLCDVLNQDPLTVNKILEK